jgi:predicted permease
MPDAPAGRTGEPGGSAPDWARHVRERLAGSLRLSPTREQDIVDELAQHLDDRWRALVSGGLPPEQAKALALAEFRDRDTLSRSLAALRQARTPAPLTAGDRRGGWLGGLWRDLRHAVRLLRRSPGFTVIAVLTLALVLGANTAIFSLIDAVLFRTLPVDRPQELVFLRAIGPDGASAPPPYPWVRRAREDTRAFAGVAVFATDEQRVEIDGQAEQVFGQAVSGSFFDVLGLEPVIGRLLTPDDERMSPPVAVIGYGYWQRRFGGRADVLGRSLTVGGRSHAIVGVTAPAFSGLQPGRRVEVTTPIDRASPLLRDGARAWCETVARLRPGVSATQAAASADAAFRSQAEAAAGGTDAGRRFERAEAVPAARGLDRVRVRYSTSLQALMALALAVLVVGCGNLGTLLLVRGEGRAREMAIRRSAGATGGQLLRQLLAETLLLVALGAAAGLVLARAGVAALVGFFAVGRNAIELDAHVDWRAAAFAAGVALVAAAGTGAWPALRALRVDPQLAMRIGDPRLGGARRPRGAARLLIGGQITLCLLLLVSALLLAATMRNLRRVDAGFAADRVLTQSLQIPASGPAAAAQRARFWARVLERVRTLPGARAASVSTLTPMSGRDTGTQLAGPAMEGRPPADRGVRVNHVSEDYLAVFGIRLLQGRAFARSDRTAPVAVITRSTQAAVFGDRSVVGQVLELAGGRRYRVIGVVEDSRHQSLREPRARMVYLPVWQPLDPVGRVTLSVATHQDPMSLAGEIGRRVREVDPGALVSDVVDLETQVDATVIGERLLTALGSAFALLALALAAIGVYGVLGFAVAERRGELALRLALGAPPSRIRRDIWREVQGPIAGGIACGLPLAWASSSLVRALLFGVTPLDVGAYVLATAAVVGVAIAAAVPPMLRAASIDPADVMHR